MKFNILTLFPDMFSAVNTSMVGRAVKNGLIDFNVVNIRDFSTDKHKKTDDMPFGGGQGMLLMAQPLWGAMNAVGAQNKRVIYMSPRGKLMDQDLIEDLAQEDEIVILCGHYEGVDQRVLDYWNCEEVSIGDYVLTGGELASMVMIDAVARMIPGVLASREAAVDESVYSGLLEYPQYTQPRSFEGLDVPEVLLNGNHQLIHLWKLEQALRLTKERRPDLFQNFLLRRDELTRPERKVLDKVISEGSEDEQGK
ncbi:MAG: tRNA (guanosine(37)-N1)-methyltransferase TrmD [Eubacterium sp.]